MTLCLNVDTYAQQNDEPDYILGRPMTEEEIEEQRSFIPKNMPILPEYTPPVLEEQSTYLAPNGASYASRYNAAEHGLVTPVKNQNTSNWCWVYSTVSSMETSLIKKKIVTNGAVSTASNLDLSEASLAYYMYNRTVVSDPLGLTRYDKNIYHPNAGETSYVYYSGNNILLAEFLSTSMGIKNESYFTLQNAYDGYTPDISSAYKNNVALLKSTVFIPDDTNSLKSAILTYGSATVGIYYDDYYYNFNTGAYSYPYTTSVTNHAVTVVGWDDSYSYTNFESTSNVTRNGAWIVKNS